MKYEAEIDLRNGNTSHALLVQLVGYDRRVLDVGCATGYLGRALRNRGCRVSGVELDPEAAEQAEQALDDVLVGDVESLDLVGHFGKESFDVVVFGDVLEHLADPLAMLRKVRPLLSESGAVVASVPNVAHGAVRLALLAGRFDYGPRGLLDATHLRFFTRESLHELFQESGLVPVDVRRTTAGVFDTEIALRRDDFDQTVVDAVEGDPESTTYQFVVRAVPEDSPEAIGSRPGASAYPGPPARCRLGVWADWAPDDLRTALEVRVTAAELGRRLPGAVVRPFSSSAALGPSPHDGGLAVEALAPWSEGAAAALAAELDCAVIVGAMPPGARVGDDPARYVADGLGADAEAECPVVWSAVRLPGGGDAGERVATRRPYVSILDGTGVTPGAGSLDDEVVTVPDPLLLAPRLLRPEAIGRRLEFARMMGWFPVRGRAVVIEVDAHVLGHTDGVAAALDRIVTEAGSSVVLVALDAGRGQATAAAEAVAAAATSPVYRVPPDALVDDVMAVVAGADAVAACSSSALAAALGFSRPTVQLRLAGDGTTASGAAPLTTTVTDPADLVALGAQDGVAARPDEVAALQTRLDAHFDRIAAIADAAAALRPRPSPGPAVLAAPEHVAAMELAYRRMQERLDAERRAVADHLAVVRVGHEAELRALQAQLDAIRAERDVLAAGQAEAGREAERQADLQRRLAAVTAELEALKGIRILRLLRPARAVYARLRGGRL